MFSCEGIFQSHHTTVCIRILCLREKLAFINSKNGLPEKKKVGTRAGHFHLSLSSFLRKCCLQWAWVVTPNGLFLTTFFKEGWMSEPIAWWQKTLIIHSAHILLWLHTTHCENWELYIGSSKQAKKSRDSFKKKSFNIIACTCMRTECVLHCIIVQVHLCVRVICLYLIMVFFYWLHYSINRHKNVSNNRVHAMPFVYVGCVATLFERLLYHKRIIMPPPRTFLTANTRYNGADRPFGTNASLHCCIGYSMQNSCSSLYSILSTLISPCECISCAHYYR